ncbi:MAG: VOC family protein [Ramlibacter sp.]
MNALSSIRQLDYTVIHARDMAAMRRFYGTVMGFPLLREMSAQWIEYAIGSTVLALTVAGGRYNDSPPAAGAAALQLAFRVAPKMVDACAQELAAAGVTIVTGPRDEPFGHRTLFFRDPDGNVLEIYAEL